MLPQKTYDQLNLEALYDILGHDSYTKLIIVFEKYLLYGKSVASTDLDYSQYKSFISSNNICNDLLTRKKTEILFNQVKRDNCKFLMFYLAINFEKFLMILIEFAKILYPWEKSVTKAFQYYFNILPC